MIPNSPILGFRAWEFAPEPRRVHVQLGTVHRTTFSEKTYVPVDEVEEWIEKKEARRPVPILQALASKGDGAWARPGDQRFYCPKHDQPSRECQCGLYAWFDADRVTHYRGADMYGAVIAWGRVVFHGAAGFRAESARIVALSKGKHVSLTKARAVANFHGVPLVPVEEIERVGREFGAKVRVEYVYE